MHMVQRASYKQIPSANNLKDIFLRVDSLIFPGYEHPDYNYELEVNGYAAWLATLLVKIC